MQSGNCSIQGNVCYDNSLYGIYLLGASSGNMLTYNSIVGNTCNDNEGIGIFIGNYAVYNVIDGNMCYNNSAYGIRESTTGADNNTFVGNVCNENPTENMDINGSGSIEANNIS